MLSPEYLLESFLAEGVNMVTGVPDSLLAPFCSCLIDRLDRKQHVVAANEGNAVALALGHFLGTGRPALVYMQNSGIGNAVNPLLSLADREVYAVPMVLVIGWRGKPGQRDEPQHVKQGRVLPDLLEAMEIPWFALDAKSEDLAEVVSKSCKLTMQLGQPVAILVSPETFSPYQSIQNRRSEEPSLSREKALHAVMAGLPTNSLVVATTGKISRELYEYRAATENINSLDFLTVGGMGHASSIAMGLAASQVGRRVVCLDGDGAALMHMGAMAIIGQSGLSNLIHVVLNNGAHDSVGGQPTVGWALDWVAIARSCGYRKAVQVSEIENILETVRSFLHGDGPVFLEILVKRGARSELGRPKESPLENLKLLMVDLV